MYQLTISDIENSMQEKNFYSFATTGFYNKNEFSEFLTKLEPNYDDFDLLRTSTPPPEDVDRDFLSQYYNEDNDEFIDKNLAGIWNHDEITKEEIPLFGEPDGSQTSSQSLFGEPDGSQTTSPTLFREPGADFEDNLEMRFSKCSLMSPVYENLTYSSIEMPGSRYTKSESSSLQFPNDESINSPLYGEECDSPLSPTTSSSSSRSPVPTSPASRRRRISLSHLSEHQKYLRCRDQNNEASRKYRERKKLKYKEGEEEIRKLTETNEKLKQLEGKLKTQIQQCIRIKKSLQKMGYKIPSVN